MNEPSHRTNQNSAQANKNICSIEQQVSSKPETSATPTEFRLEPKFFIVHTSPDIRIGSITLFSLFPVPGTREVESGTKISR